MLFFFSLLATTFARPITGNSLPDPLHDPFYSDPGFLQQLFNGEIYNSRQVAANIELYSSSARVDQVAYRTTNTQGNPSYSVVTVYSPRNPGPYPKVMSYQVYEDSANLNCAPSYSLAKGLLSPNAYPVSTDTAAAIAFGLSQGYYVLVPDHEGIRSAFIAGHEQGQAGLDGIRAGISFLHLLPTVPIALLGYSGGGSATVWMANLHESYAPELNIVGAAHGGTPIDIEATVNHLDNQNNMFSGFIADALAGLLNSYPDFATAMWPHMDPALQNAIEKIWTPGVCMVNIVNEFMHQQFHAMTDVNIMTFPPFMEVMGNESLLEKSTTTTISVPQFPRYIWHADSDQVIPAPPVWQYVQEQCARGANIQFVPWKGDDHLSAEYLGLPDALRFVQQALDGTTPRLMCGTRNNDILTLGSLTLGSTLGQIVADILTAAGVITTPLGEIIIDRTHGYQP